MTPSVATIVLITGLLVGVFAGYPLGFVFGGLAMVVGFMNFGMPIFDMLYARLYGVLTQYAFLAVPLFIFMGLMIEKAGVSDRLFTAVHISLGRFRGGLAVATILVGTVLAASVAVIAASVTMLSLVALPAVLTRGYNKELASGACCAGGTLGILIPPSVMLVIYGPMAQVSVGRLFMGAFSPGLLLSSLYSAYVIIRCWLRPEDGPALLPGERLVPWRTKALLLLKSVVPIALIILAVLGSIFFGVASPTEAAALGAVAAMILAYASRSLNLGVIKEAVYGTMRTFSMIFIIVVGASFFTGVFLSMGCGNVFRALILSVPFGSWGVIFIIMLILFILGMLMDWVGILMIMVPIVTPVVAELGFDPVWFAMMVCVNLQLSFLSPPFAYALFYLKGVTTPDMKISTVHIYRGVVPFILIIMITLGLCAVFPEIILWLPNMMVK